MLIRRKKLLGLRKSAHWPFSRCCLNRYNDDGPQKERGARKTRARGGARSLPPFQQKRVWTAALLTVTPQRRSQIRERGSVSNGGEVQEHPQFWRASLFIWGSVLFTVALILLLLICKVLRRCLIPGRWCTPHPHPLPTRLHYCAGHLHDNAGAEKLRGRRSAGSYWT